ncbi:MAG: RHS repeat-associated core domain-containing protein [Actinomycetota bacterium]
MRTETKNNTNAPTNLMRFTGQLFDLDTGLYHLRMRQYDPTSGRFTTSDPLAARLLDPYVSAYVYANNPAPPARVQVRKHLGSGAQSPRLDVADSG